MPTVLYSRVCLVLALVSSVVHGLRLPIEKVARSESVGGGLRRRDVGSHTVPLQNFENDNYNVNITMGGKLFSVLIDTGSSDLWIAADVPNAQDTGATTNITYGIGSVEGKILEAPLTFAGYSVPNQAFIYVQDASSIGVNPQDFGFSGLIGLGPPIISNILATIDTISAVPVMNSIFEQNTTSQNYITLYLARDDDPDSTSTSQLTVSEPLTGYESILQQAKLPVAILSEQGRTTGVAQTWTAFTDVNGVLGPDGQPIYMTSVVPSAWNGTVATLFDSGTTMAMVPHELSDALYSKVEGAVWNATFQGGIWTLPCKQELNVTLVFGGQKIFIHPLDLVSPGSQLGNPELLPINGTAMCYGTFQPWHGNDQALSGGQDITLGMGFLRNAYILFDYGDMIYDSSTDRIAPFIQLLALTDSTKAHTDFVNVRLNNNTTAIAADVSEAIQTVGGKSWFWPVVIVLGGVVLLAGCGLVFLSFHRQQAIRDKREIGGFFMLGQGGERKYRSMGAPIPAGVDDHDHDHIAEEKLGGGGEETVPLTETRYQDPFLDTPYRDDNGSGRRYN
ncbi:hypothetical protein FRB94_003194 [Tulasnella sp. JGI-2019a]|nr:hypothetical protein FRB93_004169 [Tulasnella sp. JGI-2019a]KAG9003310.1 hypothetical protein FRB94_003194 [Tulasnella sp. JGI-2019a]KAG9024304.1 hypothetical protein FRB95_011701 [Tulasnella sp. JGI-2019a]